MSDIPFEVQTDIIQRIPDTKSVIRCRSVSKAWRSVIDSKDFVKAHTLRHQAHNRHHLLIKTLDCEGSNDFNDPQVKYYSIVDDDDTFPHQKVSVFVPDSVRTVKDGSVIILGGSHGLFCLYESEKNTAVIWNPSIGKTVAIPVPEDPEYWTVVGFGVCPRNLDPKLIKITHAYESSRLKDVNASTQVEVFTLSSGGTWRSPLCSNLPHKSIIFGQFPAVVDGFIYWEATDSINVDDDDSRSFELLIMSFDLTTEEFTKVNLPDPLALHPTILIFLSNLRESLAVLEYDMYAWRRSCGVWVMIGHGCARSFNKLYSISTTDVRTTLGFRKSGAPIIEVHEDQKESYFKTYSLAIYEPESNNITNIGIHKLKGSFFVHSYPETLLLQSVLPQ